MAIIPKKNYFTDAEMKCKCGCGITWMNSRLRITANIIREAFGHAIIVNSGFRCLLHNQAVGGVTKSPSRLILRGAAGGPNDSNHTHGTAMDMSTSYGTPKQLHALALKLYKEGELIYLAGLGLYSWGIHIDVDPWTKGVLRQWNG